MASMTRALHGPSDNEYTLILENGDSFTLMNLLEGEIVRYERKRKLSDAEWMACDAYKRIYRALHTAFRDALTPVPPGQRPN
jgi:hypothetical protein